MKIKAIEAIFHVRNLNLFSVAEFIEHLEFKVRKVYVWYLSKARKSVLMLSSTGTENRSLVILELHHKAGITFVVRQSILSLLIGC